MVCLARRELSVVPTIAVQSNPDFLRLTPHNFVFAGLMKFSIPGKPSPSCRCIQPYLFRCAFFFAFAFAFAFAVCSVHDSWLLGACAAGTFLTFACSLT